MAQSWQQRFAESADVLKAPGREQTVVCARGIEIGGGDVVVMAGPCSVESEFQLLSTARRVSRAGARILRGGAFKPRSSPYAFQGLGEDGLRILAQAGEQFGLAVVTEVMAPEDVQLVARYADILQIGSRNMENFALLKAAAASGLPILLKRGLTATVAEWLRAAQWILDCGNPHIILCERGIRTFETAMRNTLDIASVALIKRISHLPVIVDPSHAAGVAELVPDLARIGVAAGADGIIVEVHPQPSKALSDGDQSLNFDAFDEMMLELDPLIALSRMRAPRRREELCLMEAV